MDNKDYYVDNSNVVELCGDDFQDKIVLNKNYKNKYGLIKAYAPLVDSVKDLKMI